MKNILKIVIPALILAVLVFGVIALPRLYRTPLGEPLTIIQSEQPQAAPTVLMAEAQPEQAEAAPTAVPSPTPAGTCGRTGTLNLLMLGVDASIGVPPHGADAIRLVQVDFDNAKVTSMAFSRDLEVTLDGETMILCSMFKHQCDCTQGDERAKLTGASCKVAQLMYDSYGVKPDHYFTIKLDEFIPMVDTIGGVDVTNPEEFTNERGTTFAAGKLHLDGLAAADFIRSMEPGGDPARVARQNLFIDALRAKLLTFDVLTKIPELYGHFEDMIITDLSPEDITQLSCMLKEVPPESISIYEMDRDQQIKDNKGAKYAYEGDIKNFLLKLFTH